MNSEAIANDINMVLDKHGVSSTHQHILTGLLTLALTPGGKVLFERFMAGATLLAVDDHGSVSVRNDQTQSTNGALLNRLLQMLPPGQLGHILTMLLEELGRARNACQCPACVAARSGSRSPIDKGIAEAHSRSKH
jgi:hypothetical protein